MKETTEIQRMMAALENRIFSSDDPIDDTTDIKFEDLFNVEDIQRIQDAFADSTGVASIITDTKGRPITRPSNFCRLCQDIIRNTAKGRANCYRSDEVLGRMKKDGPAVQPCLSGGLWDGGTSICVGDRHIANWLIGQVLDTPCNDSAMMAYAREIGADEAEFQKALADVKRMPVEQFVKVANSLFLIARKLSELALRNVQQARHIDERKRIERQLALLTFSLDHAKEGALLSDEEGRFLYVNEEICRALRYSREELLKLSVVDIVAGYPQKEWQQHVLDLKSSGSLTFETIHKTKDGTTYPVEIHVCHFEYEGSAYILAMTHDIAERKRTESALRDNEAKMRSILENIGIGVVLVSPEKEIIEVNHRMRELFPNVNEDWFPFCYTKPNKPSANTECQVCAICMTLKDGRVHESSRQTR